MGLFKPTSGLTEAQIINLIGQHAPTTEGVNETRVLELINENLPVTNAALVSYVGNGSYTELGACCLNFDFAPTVIFCLDDKVNNSILLTENLPTEYTIGYGFGDGYSSRYGKKSEDGKSIYWYNNEDSDFQWNVYDVKYNFLGIKF